MLLKPKPNKSEKLQVVFFIAVLGQQTKYTYISADLKCMLENLYGGYPI